MSGLKDFKAINISQISIKGGQSEIVMTREEWNKKGIKFFGSALMDWRFVCPACGHVATPRDFYPYRFNGASPDSATCECIGRYDGHIHVCMGEGSPCNYSGLGFIDLCPVRVMDGDKESRCFAFDEASTRKEEAANG